MATTSLGLTKPSNASTQAVTELLQKAYINDAYLQTVKPDPYFNNKDLIKPLVVGDKTAVAKNMMDTFFVNVTPENTGARSVTLAFVEALDMDPVEGNTSFIGNEDEFEMKWTQVQANDWAGGVTLQKYGIDYRELFKAYKLNQIAPQLLMQWRAEIMGYYAREALVQGLSHNLTAAPISATQSYNKNWYVPSLSDANQPSYNATAASHATAIGNAVASAGASALFDIPKYLDMIEFLQDSYLQPVHINGKPMWMQMIAPKQMRRLKDPSVSNSWGAYWKEIAATEDIRKIVPMGQFVVDDKLILVEDRRTPTMVVTGNASARTLSFGYDKAGRTTTRNTSLYTSGETYYCDLSPVLGAGSLFWYEPEKTHKEKQADEYGQFEGNALFQAIGFYSPKWDVDSGTADSTTALQESSFICATIRA